MVEGSPRAQVRATWPGPVPPRREAPMPGCTGAGLAYAAPAPAPEAATSAPDPARRGSWKTPASNSASPRPPRPPWPSRATSAPSTCCRTWAGLPPPHLDPWRQGRVACLERTIQAGLGKHSTAMRTLAHLGHPTRAHAQQDHRVPGPDPGSPPAAVQRQRPAGHRAGLPHALGLPRPVRPEGGTAAQGGGPAAGPGRGGPADRVDLRRLRHQRRGPAPHAGRPNRSACAAPGSTI